MHLKRFTDLGLRILMHLANEADPETPHSVPELSRFLCWNQNLVIKTANAMVKAGWLSAVRGRHGGLRLACKPEDLRIGDVVRILEDNDMLVDCNEPPCPFAGRCVLIDALARAREAFYKELNQYTLADLRRSGPGNGVSNLMCSRAQPFPTSRPTTRAGQNTGWNRPQSGSKHETHAGTALPSEGFSGSFLTCRNGHSSRG